MTNALWSNKIQKNAGEFQLDVLELHNFLIDIIFIDVDSVVFQQVIGIPMGTDCAHLIADLFLISFEFSLMN